MDLAWKQDNIRREVLRLKDPRRDQRLEPWLHKRSWELRETARLYHSTRELKTLAKALQVDSTSPATPPGSQHASIPINRPLPSPPQPHGLLPLHEPHSLILALTPPRPLRRHINSLIFLAVPLRLVLVHRVRLVLRGAIHRVQDQRVRPGIDELVLRARGHDDEVAGFHVLVFAGDGGAPAPGGEGQDLVDCVFL